MSYAEVLVFSPRDEKTEHQNGRTDKNGRFAFCPDVEGVWRVEISDGMGHKIDTEVEVRDPADHGAKPEAGTSFVQGSLAPSSRFLRTTLGLSLIANLFLAFYLWKRKRARVANPYD